MAGNGGVIGPTQTVTPSTSDIITTVTSSTPSAVTTNPVTSKIDFIVVAGGASGSGKRGGGGGAGGYRLVTSKSFSVTSGTAYPITVGGGGTGVYPGSGAGGSSSVFSTITSTGGGKGVGNGAGNTGGSGSGGGAIICAYAGTLSNSGTINVDGGIISTADNSDNTSYPCPQGGAGSYQLINLAQEKL